MTGRMPPVPPGSRSPKGPGSDRPDLAPEGHEADRMDEDKAETGQAANTRINATHQGGRRA